MQVAVGTLLGIAVGVLGTLRVIDPSGYKTQITETKTELKGCASALNEQKQIINGMLMNK
jgi:uncharacterized membrane-anchored protein YhcB (DUF1043 family)